MQPTERDPSRARIRPRWWIGAIAVIVYIAFAAGLGLWPAMVLHALTDFSLTIGGGSFGGPVSATQPSPLIVIPQAAVWVLLVVLLISCIRQDLNARRDRSAQK